MIAALGQSTLREELRALVGKAEAYFNSSSGLTFEATKTHFSVSSLSMSDEYWQQVPTELQQTAEALVDRLLTFGARVAEAAKSSSLTGSEDQNDVKLSIKEMRSALRLRRFRYVEADVLHDGGTVLELRPASQSELFALAPKDARKQFLSSAQTIGAVLRIVEASAQYHLPTVSVATSASATYRAGTAFIMMWMDPTHPELTDVADAVREVFRTFDILAVRADDIEHELSLIHI